VDALWEKLPRDRGPVIVIHPAGSTQRARLWPHYGGLAQKLRETLSAEIIFIGAASESAIIKERIADLAPSPLQAVGWSIPQVAELIRRADLFVGTDSGPGHLADAVGTKGVIIYAPQTGLQNQVTKWKPEGPKYCAILPETDCGECGANPCSLDRQRECVAAIPMEKVIMAARNLL
jgi:ADP-heptose:LPS heptosyltransferase